MIENLLLKHTLKFIQWYNSDAECSVCKIYQHSVKYINTISKIFIPNFLKYYYWNQAWVHFNIDSNDPVFILIKH